MLKTALIPLTTVLCTIFLMMSATAEGVHIPDANLRTAINKTLNKPNDAPITVSEMLNLTELNVEKENIGISTLTGLEHATKLTELSLVGKHLTIEERGKPRILYDGPLPTLHNPTFPLVDVTPLSNLKKLTKLRLKDIRIVDVTPLSNLKKLTELNLVSASLLDISPLSALTNLSKLDLSVNGILDVSALTHLSNLKDLSLETNRISSVSPLSELTQLTTLDLSANHISNVSPLAALTQLGHLNLSNNIILDISSLTELTHLKVLTLWNNPLNADAINIHIPTIEANDTEVLFSDHDILTLRVADLPTAPKGMVLIPAGEFQMGSNDYYDDEKPVHTVYVDAFYMDKYEVTNAQYKRFVDANPQWRKDRIQDRFHEGNYLKHWDGNNYPSGKADHPVVYVSWYAATAYAKWADKRLPTEAEWEKAARGGLPGLKYPWGNSIDSRKANYANHVKDTTVVGKYPAHSYGLHNVSGNVSEWCLDKWDANFYSVAPARNPLSGADSIQWLLDNYTEVKTSRVLRGGSWHNNATNVRVAHRNYAPPTYAGSGNGFRCVRETVTP